MRVLGTAAWHPLMILLGLWCSASPTLSEPAARLVCAEPVYRFGERFADDPAVEHTFVLRNEGSLTVELGPVESRCGCINIRLSRPRVPPGETATLTAVLSLRRRPGPVRETILVYSSDPAQHPLELAFEGSVLPEVELQPTAALLGRVSSTTVAETVIQVSLSPRRADTVLEVMPTVPWLEADLREKEAKQFFELVIRTRPPLPQGPAPLRAAVWLRAKGGRRGEWEIPVVGWILPPITVSPDVIPVSSAATTPFTRYLLVQTAGLQNVRIEEVQASVPGCRVTVVPLDQQSFQIRLEGLDPNRIPPGASVSFCVVHSRGREELHVPFQHPGFISGPP